MLKAYIMCLGKLTLSGQHQLVFKLKYWILKEKRKTSGYLNSFQSKSGCPQTFAGSSLQPEAKERRGKLRVLC